MSTTLKTILIALFVAVVAGVGGYAYANSTAPDTAEQPVATASQDPSPEPTPTPMATEANEDADNLAPEGYWPTETTNDTASTLTPAEAEFVASMEDYFGTDYSASEEEDWAFDGRNYVCGHLNMGARFGTVIGNIGNQRGLNEADSEFVVTSAVSTMCPAYTDDLAYYFEHVAPSE